jgi:hypothetical protein
MPSAPSNACERNRPPIREASYTTGLSPSFISSYAATSPEMPAPTTATSAP